jgi:hypothetical protein
MRTSVLEIKFQKHSKLQKAVTKGAFVRTPPAAAWLDDGDPPMQTTTRQVTAFQLD